MKTPVIMDMLQETGSKLGRAAVALACAASLTVSGTARAQEPEAEAEGPKAGGEPTDELNPQAERETVKAVEHFNNGAYVDAEASFNRVAFFVPNWRPLHYNLAVVAEAQGKIGTAVTEYKLFRPYARPDEKLLVDQRIDELGRRKGKIGGAYKRQIALSATALTLGVGGIAGGAVLFVFMAKRGKEADELINEAEGLEAQSMGNDLFSMQAADKRAEAADLTKNKSAFLYGGVYLVIFGLLATAYSIIPLGRAIKSKRQLDGLSLGRTKLQWTGGAGMRLRF
jgi:hypothetical protein